MFKIAYGAGHNIANVNGIPKALDPKTTGEWELNDRVARYFAEAAKEYPVELLRVDDPAGLEPVSLAQRCQEANDWKADFFLSIHHNAGINGGKGGGIVAFSYAEGTLGAKYRDAIYEACLAAGGLKGDRWDPTQERAFYVLGHTNMPAVLMEYGFMDSTTDVPVILTEEYAKAMGYATMEGIAKVAGLEKLAVSQPAASNAAGEKWELLSLPVLRKGSQSESVRALQMLLNGYGYNAGTADGIFGAQTEAALISYQSDKGMIADGVVWKSVWDTLLGVPS